MYRLALRSYGLLNKFAPWEEVRKQKETVLVDLPEPHLLIAILIPVTRPVKLPGLMRSGVL